MESFITYFPETSTILFGRAWEPRQRGGVSGQDTGYEDRLRMADDGQAEVLLDRLRALAADRDGHKDGAGVEALRVVSSKLHARTIAQGGQRVAAVSQLMGSNSSTASSLLRVMATLSPKEVHAAETLVSDLVWLLYRIALRDPKFSSKVRAAGASKVLHVVLRTQASGGRLLLPALHILQVITKNPSVSSALARDGVAPTLEKLLSGTGVLPSPRLRLILLVIANLCRTRPFLARLCRGPLLPLLLRPMSRWDSFSGRVRLRICQCTLVALQYAVSSKAGRKALVSGSGAAALQRFCRLCPEEKAYDAMVSRVCGILQQLGERKGLPVQSWVGPATFQYAPGDHWADGDGGCSDDSGDEVDDAEDPDDDEDDDGEAELDDEEGGAVRQDTSGQSSRRSSHRGSVQDVLDAMAEAPDSPHRRDSQELVMYAPFCRELLDTGPRGAEMKPNPLAAGDESSGLAVLQGVCATLPPRRAYCALASRVRAVVKACKVAYPDMVGGGCGGQLQPLSPRDRRVCRAKLLQCVDRVLQPGQLWNIVAYDLDRLIAEVPIKPPSPDSRILKNDDESRLGSRQASTNGLRFESRFESGNLRKAIQIGHREYDLILSSDVNSTKHHQWFYFEVCNMEGEAPYVFNIVNNEKANSQFNFGMQPIVYSVREATLGRAGWTHMGTDICYYRNSYQRPDGRRGRLYHTTTFSIKFPHSWDVCYIAYHYPYTYTQLLMQVLRWSRNAGEDVVFRAEPLCRTLNGNEVPLLTVTAKDTKQNPIQGRSILFLTARVHPGESNSSHVIQGTLDALLAPTALGRALRAAHVIKVVPMLNVEGVVNGCHRCGLTNDDLNRKWSKPDPKLHPSIYHTKGLLEYLTRVQRRPPFVFIDFHGHSRKKNIFVYGCSRADSWSTADRAQPDNPAEYAVLPQLMSLVAPAFSLSSCSYRVERAREATARVTVWRELGVNRAYTLEASYCGCDQGPYQGYQLSSAHLREVGANLCQALASLPEETERQRRLQQGQGGLQQGQGGGMTPAQGPAAVVPTMVKLSPLSVVARLGANAVPAGVPASAS
ncbi:cytosolic carboxypeptidase 1-like isoform X1 [Frankliniella occidentalis]|uniref:tubulin-glutamate carboxypeptidase n=2 Tax=Frankliniella occidentalis TaxID=133901 RepID=A0A6J1S618_FRAOC|nr:cytosolic carboxypeptidase 1-like isoform X1 [Frankliniella occidentalis]